MPTYVNREVRIREVYKRVPNKNPLAGNAFIEVGEPIRYEVVGPFGVMSTHRKESKAEEAKKEWQKWIDEIFEKNPEIFERIR